MTDTPKRRWYQFSLMTLLVVMTLAGVGLGWLAHERNEVRKRQEAIAAIEKLGGQFSLGGTRPFPPPWLRPLLGDNSPSSEITSVHLLQKRVRDADLVHLAKLNELEELRLPGTLVTDAGLIHLASLKKLKYLHLQDTQITDAGLVHLQGLTNLVGVRLEGTQVTDDGCKKLSEFLPTLRTYR